MLYYVFLDELYLFEYLLKTAWMEKTQTTIKAKSKHANEARKVEDKQLSNINNK
jgi:hypothetical protein